MRRERARLLPLLTARDFHFISRAPSPSFVLAFAANFARSRTVTDGTLAFPDNLLGAQIVAEVRSSTELLAGGGLCGGPGTLL